MACWRVLWLSCFLLLACGGEEAPTFTPTPIQDRDQDGFVRAEDCDDTDDTTYPGAPEGCDELDNDCDQIVDEGSRSTFYLDQDGDGYGSESIQACEAQPPFVAAGGDCNDRDPAIHPGVEESCLAGPGGAPDPDGRDNDCDGAVDEDLTRTFYLDADGDGYGDEAVPTQESCERPEGYVEVGGDCDDSDGAIHPGAQEVCGGPPVDEDCDGFVDGADPDLGDLTTYYRDRDGDGFGNVNIPLNTCALPEGYVLDSGDCDDASAAVYPGAPETCDGRDNDCDGKIDDADPDLTDAPVSYPDTDGDGFGDTAAPTARCTAPKGNVSQAGDCDDTRATVYPGAPERCDSPPTGAAVDNDCDGEADEATAVNAQTYYPDADGDTLGANAGAFQACLPPAGTVAHGGDCDDTDPTRAPGLPERPGTGLDEDCDGIVDEGAEGDRDGDGADTRVGPGLRADCDDFNPDISPDAWEIFGDGIDNDCDGKIDADFYVLRSGVSPQPGKPVYATIQAAIGVARSGQLIAVGPGTYLENVSFAGKNLTLYAMQGPQPTVIDGSRGGSAVRFVTGEGPGAALVGFSLVGGDGVGCPAQVAAGGGICVVDASPTIRGNIIALNSASRGGGIYGRGFHGRIEGNLIRLNTATGVGAGVYLERSNPRFVDNDVSENVASLDGGGLYITQGSPLVRGSRFTANEAFVGGGIYLESGRGSVAQCALRGNVAAGWGGGLNGVRDGSVLLNLVVAGNEAGIAGGGMRLFSGASVIHHLTCVANVSATGGGLYLEGTLAEELAFSILAFNEAATGPNAGLAAGAAAPITAYNGYFLEGTSAAGVANLTLGEGDLIENPRFVNDPTDGLWEEDDYHLLGASPFVDVRVGAASGTDPDGSGGDLGAYGGPLASP